MKLVDSPIMCRNTIYQSILERVRSKLIQINVKSGLNVTAYLQMLANEDNLQSISISCSINHQSECTVRHQDVKNGRHLGLVPRAYSEGMIVRVNQLKQCGSLRELRVAYMNDFNLYFNSNSRPSLVTLDLSFTCLLENSKMMLGKPVVML